MHLRNDIPKQQLIESTKLFYTNEFGFIHYLARDIKSNEIVAWLSFSEVSEVCLGFNALVNDFEYYNLYRYLMLEAAQIAHKLDYKYLNIQGSEDESQYNSKLRMKPEYIIKKRHIVFEKA